MPNTVTALLLVVAALVVGANPPATAADPPTTIAVTWGSHREVPEAARSEVEAVSAGHVHSLALKADGTVVAWGQGGQGQTAVPPGLAGVTAVAAGWLHSLALKDDGTVVAWGNRGYAYVPAGLTGVTAIAARKHQDYSMALRADGTVLAWGTQVGPDDYAMTLSGVQAISGGGDHSLALLDDGTVVAWGTNGSGQTDVPAGLVDVQEMAAGSYGNVVLRTDGTLVYWGGTARLPARLTGVQHIASGGAGVVALLSDGTVVSSRTFGHPQPPPGLTDVRAISVGSYHVSAVAGANPPPAPVTGLTALAGDGRVLLAWDEPGDPDYWYVRILRSQTGFADRPFSGGDQVPLTESVQERYADDFAHNGPTYYYTVFARDATGGWSEPATVAATPVERTPPAVVLVQPREDAPAQARDRNVVVRFSEALDPSSVTAQTLSLVRDGSTRRVPATVRYDAETARAYLDPTDPLASGATYVVSVSRNVTDLAGNRLATAWSSRFTVSTDDVAPTVESRTPAPDATGADPAAVVTVTFSEAMRAALVNPNTFFLRRVGGDRVPATVGCDPLTGVATLDPGTDLAPGATYAVRLSTVNRDLAGNRLTAAQTWRFTTAP